MFFQKFHFIHVSTKFYTDVHAGNSERFFFMFVVVTVQQFNSIMPSII